MKPEYTAAIFGLVGALIGSISSVLTIIIQARLKDRRDRMQQVTTMAMEHFKIAIENQMKAGRGGGVLPPSVFAAYYLGFLNLMEKGDLNEAALEKLSKENDIIANLSMREGLNKKL
jgi:hypothetical protein